MVALLIAFAILLFLTADYLLIMYLRRRAEAKTGVKGEAALELEPELEERAMGGSRIDQIPEGTYVSYGHVWVQPRENGVFRLGVDRLLIALLGGLEWLYALPEGVPVRKGGPLVMLRKGDRALKVRCPVDGVVAAVNQTVTQDPTKVPPDPFNQGWIYEVTPKNGSSALGSLNYGKKAARWMQGEVNRLLDLVFEFTRQGSGQLILPDGGFPLDGLGTQIENGLKDEQWEDLVASYFSETREKVQEADS
jgi:glycine cleavage system H protein